MFWKVLGIPKNSQKIFSRQPRMNIPGNSWEFSGTSVPIYRENSHLDSQEFLRIPRNSQEYPRNSQVHFARTPLPHLTHTFAADIVLNSALCCLLRASAVDTMSSKCKWCNVMWVRIGKQSPVPVMFIVNSNRVWKQLSADFVYVLYMCR